MGTLLVVILEDVFVVEILEGESDAAYLRQHSSMSSPNTVMWSNNGMNRET